jgi:D-alanine-D-alanine ligase
VPTPKYAFAYKIEDIETIDQSLKYPMFVKHHNGQDSVGLTANSKVSNRFELEEQARFFIEKYGGALIEEYIEGSELIAFVLEND